MSTSSKVSVAVVSAVAGVDTVGACVRRQAALRVGWDACLN